MGYTLCQKVRGLTPYEPITGSYPVRLDANESPFDLARPESFPASLQKEAAAALEKVTAAVSAIPFNRYPDPYCAELRQAFAKRFGVDPALVTAFNGSDESLAILCGCLMEKGQTLVLAEPDFSMYRFYGDLYELAVRGWQKGEDLTIDADSLIAFCKKEGGHALLFSNPCNPTGQLLHRDGIIRILTALPETLVIVDEAYMEFSEDQSVMDLAETFDNLIVLKTCSKALGLAGIRLGFAVAGPILTTALTAVKSPYNVNAMTQRVGAVLLAKKTLCDGAQKAIRQSRDRLYESLKNLLAGKEDIQKIYPTGANFVFLKTEKAEKIFENLKKEGIIIRKMGGYLRITAGNDTENNALIKALERAV